MNYKLNSEKSKETSGTLVTAWRRLVPLLYDERVKVYFALVAITTSSACNLLTPYFVARVIDVSVRTKDFHSVLLYALALFATYLVGLGTGYAQTILMGGVGRRTLFALRNSIFSKLQQLPIAFFNQNKAGDLISRINNDTDKLNSFFAQALIQFASNGMLIVGAGIFLLVLNPRLGLAALVPGLLVLLVTTVLSPWVQRANRKSLQALGGLSAEIQESLENFKVVVAFNRLDYFRKKFAEVSSTNYTASVRAGIANTVFVPLYGLANSAAQIIVLGYGVVLITQGTLTMGLLIGFLLYVNNFYTPLRQLASVWSSLQQALAGLDRISEILTLETNLTVLPAEASAAKKTSALLEFSDVSFAYPEGKQVLVGANLVLEKGKTYALVGPTGGGKTTTASLMVRLFDPTAGTVFLSGKDIRTYSPQERADKIGFILQEPMLFTGTVGENILYGNARYAHYSEDQLQTLLSQKNLDGLLARFAQGLSTPITVSSDSVSLGQKQLVAFMRAVLREPELLILDEATANIDTVTEQLLQTIIDELPKTTTKVIIAHRLNTIRDADEIFFVNNKHIVPAGTLENAVDLLLHDKRTS